MSPPLSSEKGVVSGVTHALPHSYRGIFEGLITDSGVVVEVNREGRAFVLYRRIKLRFRVSQPASSG